MDRHIPRTARRRVARPAVAASMLALLVALLAACGASDPPPTSPFDDRAPAPTLPPGVATGTPPPLGTPGPDTPATPDGTATVPLTAEQATALAIGMMAEWLGFAPSDLAVAAVDPVEWPDACLDVYRPDHACAEVITPGWRVELQTILRASIHVVHIAGPGHAAWVPDREVTAEVVAVDRVSDAIEVRTDADMELWLFVPGSMVEPLPAALTPGLEVTAALDTIVDGNVIVWLLPAQ